ncbi:MAG: STN domain-containing protein [Pirellulales bacterium]
MSRACSRHVSYRRALVLLAAVLFTSSPLAADESEKGKPAAKESAVLVADKAQLDLPPGKVFPEPTGVEKRIRQALVEQTELQYLDTTLEDVAMDISLRHKIPVMLDLPALTADGKGKETPVSLQVRETSLRNGLRLLLAGQGLTYVVRNEMLLLTTKSAAEAAGSTRVYQVHDLFLPSSNPHALTNYDSLMEIIVSTVQPESWQEAGGTAGTIRSFNGPGVIALVIKQTEEAHDQIYDLLTTLRAAGEPKVLELQRRVPQKSPAREAGNAEKAAPAAKSGETEKPAAK